MAINYAQQYGTELDQAVSQGTLTNGLVTKGVKWLGAKTFRLPSISTSGYQNHSRSGGFQSGSWDMDDTPFTVTQDRSIEFFVDSMDVDETNEAASVSNITKTFLDEQANPEIDAYRFSKLVAEGENYHYGMSETISQVYRRFKRDLRKVRKYGTNGTFCWVSTEMMSIIEEAREDKITIVVQNKGTAIETRVTNIDGIDIIEVFDADRFWSLYDFREGFEPAPPAQPINWLIVSSKAVVAAVKHAVVFLFKPGEHTEGDGYLYQNRIYHDLFVKPARKDGVIASIGPLNLEEGQEFSAMSFASELPDDEGDDFVEE